ncbi:MAG: hypothetical protein JWM06_175, partial [Actinomycetia bacterium]|nr:hypothetical protein [Actinomycetes bacterium]
MSDGTSGPAKFSYSNNGPGNFSGSWSFSTTSNFSGSISLPYTYSGFHSFFQVRVNLSAFV